MGTFWVTQVYTLKEDEKIQWMCLNSLTDTKRWTMEKSVTFTGIWANEIIPSIDCSFVYKAKEGRHVRITLNGTLISPSVLCLNCAFISKITVFQSKYTTVFILLDISESK
jgi:hypothetical protein